MPNPYSNMWKIMFKLVITFHTLYLFEADFSAVNQILTRKRNALNISERGDICLMLTEVEPNIRVLISKHQPQWSHRIKSKYTMFDVFMISIINIYLLEKVFFLLC